MEPLATGYGLIEGPTWVPGRGLIFSDVLNGGAYCLKPGGSVETVVPHRKGMGGIGVHANGGLVVSGRNVAYKPADGGDTRVLFEADDSRGEMGFNDFGTDPAGRIYVGSVAFRPVGANADSEPKPGALYRIDLDGSAHRIHDHVELSNGIGCAPDGKTLYHSDTLTHAVWAYDLDVDGNVANRRLFASLGEKGRPDGLAVAQDGSIWVADADGGRVAVFDAGGREHPSITVPLPMVTSLCFGGEGLGDLYIVTGSRGAGRDDAGTVFRMRAPVPGCPVPPVRVAV